MVFVLNRPRLAATLAVLATASLLLLGDGMNPIWPVMWVAFLPILFLAAEVKSWPLAGSAAALSMFLGTLTFYYYIHTVLQAPVVAWLIPFSIASVLFALGVLLFRTLLQRGAPFSAAIALPAYWAVVEYLASFAPANGTAGSLAYTQERCLPILQIASLTGPWGISFLLLLVPSALVASLYLQRRKRAHSKAVFAMALSVLAAAVVFGAIRLAAPRSQASIKVGLLVTDSVTFAEQTSQMQQLVSSYAEEAQSLAQQGAKVIVMPEKTGLLLDRDASTIDPPLQSVADHTGASLVIGVLHAVGSQSFNEARIYTPHQLVQTYHKQHMLPPFEAKLTPGVSPTLLTSTASPIGVAICKDMDFVHPALDYGRKGVGLLLDPAWDFNVDRIWHGHIAIMRGVEGGYAIAHAAKLGLLTVTDDRGRVLGEVRSDTNPFASLLVDVPLHHDRTIFDRFGTWFPWLSALLLLATVLRCLIHSRSPILPNPSAPSTESHRRQ